MSISESTKSKLIETLEVYDEDKYYDNYKRKAYIDDNVLIKNGVRIKTIIDVFQLEKKELYKKLLSEVEVKNKIKNKINEELNKNKEQYKIFTLKYYLDNYDYGCGKYNRLHIQEIEETYIYDDKIEGTDIFGNEIKDKDKYRRFSRTMSESFINYNMTYNDLIDDTYKTIKDVVNRIKQLEEKI